ncbi:MAG TPA: autotransporter-associated beta strand repeat-containing protein, partial [Thermoguttaceae bacterium]
NITGTGTDLVTYGADGLRTLNSGEYASSLQADKNIKLSSSPTPTDFINIRSLVLDGSGTPIQVTVNDGSMLSLTSGAILSYGNTANSLTGGSITFGNNAATGYEGIVHAVNDLTIQSVIANNGSNAVSLTKSGNSILTILGSNTYTGGTSIGAGTLQIGNGGNTGSITGNIKNDAELVINRSDTVTLNNIISGRGELVKLGSNTLILTGNSTYTGLTTIDAGKLQLGSGGAGGTIVSDVLNNGELIFNRSALASYNSVISGTGSVTKLANNILTINGNNTYTGGTTISSGILRINSTGSIVGDVINNASLQFIRTNFDTFSGAISGSGNLSISGTGTLVLTAENTYSGGTTIGIGTLQIGDSGTNGSIVGNVTNNSTLVFNRADDITFAGTISGFGSVEKSGNGILTFTGANTFTKGTIINAGTLQIGEGGTTGSITGKVTNNGTLAFNHSDDITFGGIISGSGGLHKLGDGMLTLSAANTYFGNTFIEDGILKLAPSASLLSGLIDIRSGIFDVASVPAYQLNSGKKIQGNGSIAGGVSVFGTVAPGESPGMLTVGDMSFGNGSLLDIELGGSTPGFFYDVLNATGTISLFSGSTLKLSFLNDFLPEQGSIFDILSFNNLSGTFSTLDLPVFSDGRFWDTTRLYVDGTISVVPEPAVYILLLTALAAILYRQIVRRRA